MRRFIKGFVCLALVASGCGLVRSVVPGGSSSSSSSSSGGGGDGGLGDEFEADVRPVELQLLHLMAAKDPEKVSPNSRVSSAEGLETLITDGEKLGELAARCQGKYKGKDIPTTRNKDSHQHPKVACDLAINWKRYVVELAPSVARASADLEARNLESALAKLEQEGRFYQRTLLIWTDPKKFVAELRAPYDAVFQKLGLEPDAGLWAGVEAAVARFPEAARKAGEVDRWPKIASHRDKDAEKVIKAAVEASGVKLLRVGLHQAAWVIVKNDDDYPLRRAKDATIVVRRGGEAFCRLYVVGVSGQYEGGGSYAPIESRFEETWDGLVTRCP
jgi:hypothetical protein